MKEPTIVTPGRPRLAGPLLPVATLLTLAAACFAGLVVEPSGLIVNGRRPSIDYANRGDPRPVGNDLVFLFLPHHESIARRIAQFGHWPAWDARGFGGRPMAGNPQAGMAYPPVWIAWWLRAPAVLGWLTVAHLLWGGLGTYVLLRSMGAGRWAATVAAGIYQASPYLAGPHLRRPLPARLGGLLVSLGVLGLSRASRGTIPRAGCWRRSWP